jgi:acid phosphatase family membrane protein YuiD
MIDANSLRQHVGRQAAAINRLGGAGEGVKPLRERMGHTLVEISGGIVTGMLVALAINAVGKHF